MRGISDSELGMVGSEFDSEFGGLGRVLGKLVGGSARTRGLESDGAGLAENSELNAFVPERALNGGGSASLPPEFVFRILVGRSLGVAWRLEDS